MLESGNRTDLLTNQSNKFFLNSLTRISNFSDNKTHRNLSFEFLNFSNNSSLIDSRMFKKGLFHGSSGQSMSSSVDDVIESCSYIEISVIIIISSISSGVVAWSLVYIFVKESLIIVIKSTHERRRHWQSDTYFS